MEKVRKAFYAVMEAPSGGLVLYLEINDDRFYAWKINKPDMSDKDILQLASKSMSDDVTFRAPDYYNGSALNCYLHYQTREWLILKDVVLNLQFAA